MKCKLNPLLLLCLVLLIPAQLSLQVGSQQQTAQEIHTTRTPDVIFVPTPHDVVERMFQMVKIKEDDVVYDLGCGDGRLVVHAAKNFGCKAFGFDIDPERISESLENVRSNNVEQLVTIAQRDIFKLDLSPADVVTLYLLPDLNVKLIPQLEKLKSGSRIVSHDFDMRGCIPDEVVYHYSEEDNTEHVIYLWTVPFNKEKDNVQ